MNAASAACAASGSDVDWHGIDWAKCHQRVRRLQARIVKATQEGRWGKVKALQWLLTKRNRPRKGALKRLEPNEGKLSSPVLRGGNGGNVVSLPDNRRPTGPDPPPKYGFSATGWIV